MNALRIEADDGDPAPDGARADRRAHDDERGQRQNVRVSIRQQTIGEARNAIYAIFGRIMRVKHVLVDDEDIDIFDDGDGMGDGHAVPGPPRSS